jgi:hypothetical protein
MRVAPNLIGKTFGRLKVLRRDRSRKTHHGAHWVCVCECGNKITARGDSLVSRNTRSCGCLAHDLTVQRNARHGAAHRLRVTAEYRTWQKMLGRCYNKNNKDYPNYGGRGIAVCKSWQTDFAAFLRSVGPRPSPAHSLDRFPDNHGDYRPGNVRWATKKQQNRNQRGNVRIRISGVTMTLAEAVERLGLNYNRIRWRIKVAGWPLHKALELSPGQSATLLRWPARRARGPQVAA